MTEDQSSTVDTGEHSYREPQQLAMQLKVSEDMCNVPTLGHHHITECYDDQSSQMEVIASTGAIEGFFGVYLASLILFHHHDPFCTT